MSRSTPIPTGLRPPGQPKALSLPEIVGASGCLFVLAVCVYAAHVVRGSFLSDDWGWAADFRLHPERPFLSRIEGIEANRPLLTLFAAGSHAVLGTNAARHLALAACLGLLASLCFYVFLRTVAVSVVPAGVLATLVLVFPWSDSTKLWAATSFTNVAIALYLLGLIVALHGLARRGRASIVLHALSIALYLLSNLAYPAAAFAPLLHGALYARHAPRRYWFRRWLADLCAFGALLIFLLGLSSRSTIALSEIPRRVGKFGVESASLLVRAALPFPSPQWIRVFVACVLVAAVGAALWRSPRGGTLRSEGLRWARVASFGVIFITLAYVPIAVGSGLHPLRPGLDNRGNVLAALGYVTIAFGAVYLAFLAAVSSFTRGRAQRVTLLLATGLALGGGYVHEVFNHVRLYDRAGRLQKDVLQGIERAVHAPRGRTTIYTFGHAAQVSPGVPVFAETWDLHGAVRLLFHDPSLAAFPIYRGTRFTCEGRYMFPVRRAARYDFDGHGYGREEGAAYGTAIFVDVGTSAAKRIGDRAECRDAAQRFRSGPYLARR